MIRYTSRDLLSILLIVGFLFSTGIVGCSLCSLLEGFPEVWEEGQPEEREGPPLEEPSPAPTRPLGEPVTHKWDLWVGGTQLRGANIYQRRVYPELDGPTFVGSGPVGPPYTQDDFDRLTALGANYVNISHPGLFTETPPYTLDQGIQDNLDNLLDMIAKADMFAVITFRTGPGRSEFWTWWGEDNVADPENGWFDPRYYNNSVWADQAAQNAWGDMWRYAAERYRDHPIVVGYDLMCEPNSTEVSLDIWDPEEFYPTYANTLYDWNQLYPRISTSIREVDPDTPILIGGMSYSAVEWLPYLQPTGDERTVYIVHQYEPIQYTHQWAPPQNTYPGVFDTDWDGVEDQFDRAWLDNLLSTVDDFVATHGVPVGVNEFGAVRWVPNAAAFMDDQMDLFEQRGMNHALWKWEVSWEEYAQEDHAFNLRYGPDPDHRSDVAASGLLDLIVAYWGRNTVRPSNAIVPSTGAITPPTRSVQIETPPGEERLADVTHWLYLISVDLEPEVVDQIAASDYEMVVLDFIPSEEKNTDYPMADVVAQLHDAPHPKLVIAYIDIGEAEEYRTYWQEDWEVGDPGWIAGEDPDGWQGNYPVAFWYDEWQEIWLGEDGTLQQILDAGFDGVCLDWIEAYSDENVITMAEEDDVDPVQEIIWWVQDVSDFVKSHCAECVVIGQNAAELAEYDNYLEAIDAIAQEQVWLDGGADNDPPGDCPLPRTDAELDTEAYRASLSEPCRRYFDSDPNSPLHVSTEEYLHYLTLAQHKGTLIFTVDYALDPENVAWVHETSRALGFIPFVSNRALDRYVEPIF